jgi:two-component system phosphate regulon sensor histidine kinase PhoR
MRYIDQMVKMRKEQFDESVVRSLNQASRNLEQNETFRYLENFTRDNLSPSSDSLPKLYMGGAVGTADASNGVGAAHGGEKIYSDFELHQFRLPPHLHPDAIQFHIAARSHFTDV